MSHQVTREVTKILSAFTANVEESNIVSDAVTNHIKRMISEGKMAEAEEINALVALLQEEIDELQN